MIEIISSHLRRTAFLYVLATKPENIPDIMKRFVKFLKEETIEDFESTPFEDVEDKGSVNLPLTLNEKALKKLKDEMSPYPGVIKSGILPGSPAMNFLNILGQFLSNVAIVLESPSRLENEPWIEDLYKVWGSRENMNARGLAREYSGESSSKVKNDLIAKLNESIKVTEPLTLHPVH